MWAAHSGLYRDHLLRLDQASRRSRFAGGVSEQFLRDYADLAFGTGLAVPTQRVEDGDFSVVHWLSNGTQTVELECVLLGGPVEAVVVRS